MLRTNTLSQLSRLSRTK